jgi:hypothetical protein
VNKKRNSAIYGGVAIAKNIIDGFSHEVMAKAIEHHLLYNSAINDGVI